MGLCNHHTVCTDAHVVPYIQMLEVWRESDSLRLVTISFTQCDHLVTIVTIQIGSLEGYIIISIPKFKLWLCITEFFAQFT